MLDLIKRARLAREAAETELAVLVDHAVGLGIGWPEIAAQLLRGRNVRIAEDDLCVTGRDLEVFKQ